MNDGRVSSGQDDKEKGQAGEPRAAESNRGAMQAIRQARAALRKYAMLPWGQPGYTAPAPGCSLVYEAESYLNAALAEGAALTATDPATEREAPSLSTRPADAQSHPAGLLVVPSGARERFAGCLALVWPKGPIDFDGVMTVYDFVHGEARAALTAAPESGLTDEREKFDTPQGFIDWFAQNYYGEVVFSDSDWHARSIFRTAVWHFRAALSTAPPTDWLQRKIAEGPDVDIGAVQPPPAPATSPPYVSPFHTAWGRAKDDLKTYDKAAWRYVQKWIESNPAPATSSAPSDPWDFPYNKPPVDPAGLTPEPSSAGQKKEGA